MPIIKYPFAVTLLCCLHLAEAAQSAEPFVRPPVTLVDLARTLPAGMAVPTDAEIRQSDAALHVRTGHVAERPGVTLQGPGGRWNLTGFTELTTIVKNLGKHTLTVHCAVDSDDAERATRRNCCIGSVTIPPGEETMVRVDLRSRVPEVLREKLHGMRAAPSGFLSGQRSTIDPANVVGISVYVYRPTVEHAFAVSNIRAGGSPPFPLPENVDDLFPMIDRFGQYRHKDWPGRFARRTIWSRIANKRRRNWPRLRTRKAGTGTAAGLTGRNWRRPAGFASPSGAASGGSSIRRDASIGRTAWYA